MKNGNFLKTQIWHDSQIRILYLRDLNPTQQKMTQVINHHFNLTKVPFTNLNWAKITFPRILESKTLPTIKAKIQINQRNLIFFLMQFSKNFDFNFAIFRKLRGQKYQNFNFWVSFWQWKIWLRNFSDYRTFRIN